MHPSNESAVNLLDLYLQEFGPIPSESADKRKFEDGYYPKDSRAAKALEIALDIRKFEIELYWKRSGYFWLLLAALTTTIGLIVTAKGEGNDFVAANRDTLAFFVSCAAVTLSVCWAVVNHASKFWQTNWELQVDVLETRVLGPLYKTVMTAESTAGPRFSVSAANFWTSIYFSTAYAIAALYFSGLCQGGGVSKVKVLISLGHAMFLAIFFSFARSKSGPDALVRKIGYTTRTLRSENGRNS